MKLVFELTVFQRSASVTQTQRSETMYDPPTVFFDHYYSDRSLPWISKVHLLVLNKSGICNLGRINSLILKLHMQLYYRNWESRPRHKLWFLFLDKLQWFRFCTDQSDHPLTICILRNSWTKKKLLLFFR